ncbi:hypothetical protein G9A89_023239 [Geosiphon pyriformis]|nr:hypothetical protein G9A89_023239 [Geosiphon pyriformis]
MNRTPTALIRTKGRSYFRIVYSRFYASLSYNSLKNSQTIDISTTKRPTEEVKKEDKEVKLQAESVITSISAGINNASWITHPPTISDPIFEIMAPGSLGAMLLVKLPPKSEIYTTPGTAVVVSSKVIAERTTDGNIVIAIGRKLAGGQLVYHKFTTQSDSGDVLISPSSLSDIVAIHMDGRSEYYVKKGSFLARGPRVTLRIGGVSGMGVLKSFAYRVTGRGTLVISNYGAIHRLVLNAGDEYLVNPKHLIAWDALTHPSISLPLINSPPSHARTIAKNIASKISRSTPTVIDNIRNSPSVKPTLEIIERLSVRTRKWLFGGPEYLKLIGPGDFYLASRVAPVLGGLKVFTSPSIEEIDATQTKLTPPSTAPRPRQPFEPPRMIYALVNDKGNVSFADPGLSDITLLPPLGPENERSIINRIINGLLRMKKLLFGGSNPSK